MPDPDLLIPDDTRLYRRLHPTQVVWDENQNRVRASSAAFRDPNMSVSLANVLAERGHAPTLLLDSYPQHSLGWITAELVREHEQVINPDPTDDDPAHAQVVGKKTDSRQRKFAKASEIEILRRDYLRPEVQARLAEGS